MPSRFTHGGLNVMLREEHPLACKVVNSKTDFYDVYIGRPSKWGNPFKIGIDGDRTEVIKKYKDWVVSQPKLVSDIKRELKGKVLGCFCPPNPCHGDVILEILKEDEQNS